MRAFRPNSRTLVSASGLALAAAMLAVSPVARAQSFQGTVASTAGSVNITTGANTTDITVFSPSAVINWTPTDQAATGGPINFQPAGTTATFTNSPSAGGLGGFVVLNRILPVGSTRPIQFNGNVVSQLQGAAGPTPGGTVFFYSPGGILLGSTAVFDVGNLVLTASDLAYDTSGNFSTGGAYQFQPATVPGAQVQILAGAQINAPVDGSYVAMIAPSVVNSGTITVNGSAALVAADAATVTFSPNGLFDIQVDSGTSATGTVAANNGTITGAASASAAIVHRVYMVAVAKNDAITMAIGSGSSLGFDIAGAADVFGNSIVLSAGHDVTGGVADVAPSAGGGAGLVSITGGDADATSSFNADATGSVNLGSSTASGLDFASDVNLHGTGGDSGIFANAGGAVTIGGNVTVSTDATSTDPSVTATAFRSQLYATGGGTIDVTGDANISANAFGAQTLSAGTYGGNAVASFAKIQANDGGQITIGGDARLDANAFGGQAQVGGAGGGSAQAGTAWVLSTGPNAAQVTIAGALAANASGFGGSGTGCATCTIEGGAGTGGLAAVRTNSNSVIQVGASTSLSADGAGGSGLTGGGAAGTGGTVSVFAISGGQTLLADLSANANATGGAGGSTAGNGTAGFVEIFASGSPTAPSLVELTGSVTLLADANGGAQSSSGNAGNGQGGTASINAAAFGDIVVGGAAFLSSVGIGGIGSDALSAAGNGTGGLSQVVSGGGNITFASDAIVNASGFGGLGNGDFASGSGGDGIGGTARIAVGSETQAGNAGSIAVAGQTFLSADAQGGDGYFAGNATGGISSVYARYGDITLDTLNASSVANGGFGLTGGTGGAATGGAVFVRADNALEGASSIFVDQLSADASASGGFGSDAFSANSVGGNGGRAEGGIVGITGGAGNGALEVVAVSAFANATGGGGGVGLGAAGGNGGDATGGAVEVGLSSGIDTGNLNAGSATFGTISAATLVNGGNGGDSSGGPPLGAGGNGGNVSGGGASLLVRGAPVTITGTAFFQTTMNGGNGGAGSVAGLGGNALLGSTNPTEVAGSYALVTNRFNQPTQGGSLTAADLSFSASATGGTGSVNGTGTIVGGAVEFRAINSTITANSLAFVAVADGQTATAPTDAINFVNSTATIATGLTFETPSTVSLTLDQSTITADHAFISGGNWAFDGAAPATLGTLVGTSLLVLGSGADLVAHANLQTAGSLSLFATGRIDLGALSAGTFVEVVAGSTLSLDDVTAGDSIDLSALGAVVTGNMTAGTSITVETGGSVSTANLVAGSGTPSGANGDLYSIGIRSGGNVSTGSVFAASDLGIGALGSITTGDVTAYDMLLLGGGDIGIGGINAINRVLIADVSMSDLGVTATGFDKELVFGASPATATAGNISIAGLASAGQFTASTLGSFNSAAISGNSRVLIFGNSATTGDIFANGFIGVFAADALTVGNVNSSLFDVRLAAGTSDGTGSFVVGQGSVTAGNIQAGGRVKIGSGGNIATGSLRASGFTGVKVVSTGGNVLTDNINTPGDVFISGAQSVGVGGNLNARDIVLLAGDNISTAPLFAGLVLTQTANGPRVINATGRVLLANASMLSGSTLLSDTTDFNALFAAAPVRLGGSVTSLGQIIAGRFVSYSQGDMTAAGIAGFGSIEVESGGLVTVGQRWGSPSLTIASADIRIVDNGSVTSPTGQQILSGLRTSSTGEIALISLSDSPALIGDGLDGTGYSLSNAEIGLISGHQLTIGAVDVSSNPIDMLIGDVTLTAGNAIGSANLSDSSAFVLFATGNRETQTPGGAIRVVGNILGSNFADTNIVEFDTGRFELDAETGSISLTQGSTTQGGTSLGGIVEIHADNIHVASGAILDKLAADPFYAGHVFDLNSPAAVQRPEGVLRALGLDLYPTGTLYIQNTGTVLDPAGFFADFEFTDLTPPADAAPASISVIVNGKWQTPDGIIGGVAARDLVVNNADTLAFYTPDSSVNGCAINASACATVAEADPVPALAAQFEIIGAEPLGNTPQFIDDETDPGPASDGEPDSEEEEAAVQKSTIRARDRSSPIAVPQPVIDSTPLETSPLVEQPVAGSGNPSLIGSVVNEDSAEGGVQ